MNDPRTLELVNIVVDGQATPEELAEVQKLILVSPETRVTYESFQTLVIELDQEPAIEPPASFRNDLLQALHASRDRSQARAVVVPIRRRRLMPFALAAAAALIVALSLPTIIRLSEEPIDSRQAAGTMVRPPVDTWPVVARVASSEPSPSRLAVRQQGERIAVDIFPATSGEPVELRWNQEAWDFLELDGPPGDTTQIQAGKLIAGGTERTRVVLRSRSEPVENQLFLYKGGKEVARVGIQPR